MNIFAVKLKKGLTEFVKMFVKQSQYLHYQIRKQFSLLSSVFTGRSMWTHFIDKFQYLAFNISVHIYFNTLTKLCEILIQKSKDIDVDSGFKI